MTEIRVRKASVLGIEQPTDLLRASKANVYVVEQLPGELRLPKLNVVVVEQLPPEMRSAKMNVYAVEQKIYQTMFYNHGLPGLIQNWWWITPYVNIGGLRQTEEENRRVTEDGRNRRVDGGTEWVLPLEVWAKNQDGWQFIWPMEIP